MKKTSFLLLLLIVFSMGLHGQTFRAGIAKTDITPTESLYMGGYDTTFRNKPSEGVDSRIYVRAIVLDDNSSKVAIVEADVVSFPNNDYNSIRQMISAETGIPFGNIMFGTVHNHAAPYPGFDNNKGSKWSKQLNANIVSTVKAAIKDLEPVRIGAGIGKSAIAMNRRKVMEDNMTYSTFDENNASQSYSKFKTDKPVLIHEMEGVSRLGANPAGPVDDDVTILRIDKLSGEPKAVVVNYACHGTSLGARNLKISGEWNGHMLDYIEKNMPGVTGIFMPGAAGDINPRIVGGLDGYVDDLKKTAELGQEIGSEVIRVFSEIKTRVPPNAAIRVANRNITCPRRYGEVMKDWKNTTIEVPVTAIKFDQYVMLFYPLEMFHEMGKTIKRESHSPYPFIVGYSNGSMGYLTTREAHAEGGYEPNASHFDPNAEKIFLQGVGKMLMELY